MRNFTLPMAIFQLISCASKPDEVDQEYPLDFAREDNPLAFQVYEGLLAEGVTPQEMDQGWREINYTDKPCEQPVDSFCWQGTPNLLEANDVLEYAINNDQRFHPLLKKALGRSLPWSLDDLDPATTFDEGVRARAQEAIDVLKADITQQGFKEGSPEYNERMAIGVFYLATIPNPELRQGALQKTKNPEQVLKIYGMQELVDLGLGNLKDYLATQGGFYIDGKGEPEKEYTVLEAMQQKRAHCTQMAEVLHALFRMAGFDPVFVDVRREGLHSDDPVINAAMKASAVGANHVCVGLNVNGKFRLYDSSYLTPNAHYTRYTPFTLRHCLSEYYSNHSAFLATKDDADGVVEANRTALRIDSRSVSAHINLGAAKIRLNKTAEGIVEYSAALEIDPNSLQARLNRGDALLSQGQADDALIDYQHVVRLDPNLADGYFGLCAAQLVKNDLPSAITYFAQGLRCAPAEQQDPALKKIGQQLVRVSRLDLANKGLEDQFYAETRLRYFNVKMYTIFSYALWEAGFVEQSRNQFTTVAQGMDQAGDGRVLSTPTKDFFKKMLQTMPESMKQDKQVAAKVRETEKKIR